MLLREPESAESIQEDERGPSEVEGSGRGDVGPGRSII